MKPKKSIKAWADVGSHGWIYEFCGGDIADRYPHLMHIHSQRITPDLVPVRITLLKPKKKGKK